jgi:hypothetical protein
MRRPLTPPHPLATAALAGASAGLIAAVLLLVFGGQPGSRGSYDVFYTISLPVSYWLRHVTTTFSAAALLLIELPLSGAVWAIALTVLAGRSRHDARAWRVAVGSALAGTVLAVLIGIVGFSDRGPYDGVPGLIFLAQIPGMMLLGLIGYDPYMYEGRVVDEFIRLGPVTLLHFSLANTLLAAWFVAVARFTWRWIRAPMPRRGPVAEV